MYDRKLDLEKKIIKKFFIQKVFKNNKEFNVEASLNKYTYTFNWLGVPIIQYPQDIILMQK